MDKITAGKLIIKMREDSGMTLYKFSQKVKKFPNAIKKSLDDNSTTSNTLVDFAKATGNKLVIEYKGIKYELKKE